MIKYETYSRIYKKIRKYGHRILLFENKINDIDEYNEFLYNNLLDSFNYYRIMLTEKNSEAELKKQLNIDAYLSYAIALKKEKNDTMSIKQRINYKTLKKFLIDEMKKNNPLIIDTILFDSNKYYNIIFDDNESKTILNNYLNYCAYKLDGLINEYILNKEMNNYDKLLLFKILDSNLFDDKYQQEIKNFNRILISKCENEEQLERFELEYILRVQAKEKCTKNKMIYNKLYLCNCGASGGFTSTTEIVCIDLEYSMKHSSIAIPNVFHEYEHIKQIKNAKNMILNRDSLVNLFYSLFRNHLSSDEYDEYSSNYAYKLSEIYANEAARFEYQNLLFINRIERNKKSNSYSTSKGTFAMIYKDAIKHGYQKQQDGIRYDIDIYNVEMIDKILTKELSVIDEYPILKHFYNIKQKRLKNLVELSEDYSEQDILGRNTFSEFVQYQIYQDKLNEVDFNIMSETQKLDFVLMLTRCMNNLMAKIIIVLSMDYNIHIPKYKKCLFEILSQGIQFLKNNSDHIEKLKSEYDERIPLAKDERIHFYLQLLEEYIKNDSELSTKLQYGVRGKLGFSSMSTPYSPFYIMKKYIMGDMKSIIESVVDIENLSIKRNVEEFCAPENTNDSLNNKHKI